MLVPVTALYAALLGLVGMTLGGLVGRARTKANVSLGTGGQKPLIEADRRHMNWVENVPLALLLLALIELNGGSKELVHGLGLTLLACRIIHPFGLDADRMMKLARAIGQGGTYIVMLIAIVTLLRQALGW